jgi:hypothetical protein
VKTRIVKLAGATRRSSRVYELFPRWMDALGANARLRESTFRSTRIRHGIERCSGRAFLRGWFQALAPIVGFEVAPGLFARCLRRVGSELVGPDRGLVAYA